MTLAIEIYCLPILFWRLEVQIKVSGRAMLPLKVLKEHLFQSSQLLAILGCWILI